MKKLLLISALFAIGFSACDCTCQYDVWVKNSAQEDLRIVYKSAYILSGETSQEMILRSGDNTRIISSKNIEPEEGCPGCVSSDCTKIAEYIKAYNKDSTESKTQWCDKDIKLSKVDIGQAEFIIEFTPQDFN